MTPAQWRQQPLPTIVAHLGWGNPSEGDRAYGPFNPFNFRSGGGEYSDGLSVFPARRHALAALALYGQPFGFTREDITLLSEAAGYIESQDHVRSPQCDALMDLAARIEALLPPEGTDGR